VSGFLRFIGIANAAVWFGGGFVCTAIILPGVFSPNVRALFGDEYTFRYYAGGVALALFSRFFILQYFCGVVALAHLFAEKLYLGRAIPKLGMAIVLGALAISLVGGAVVQPRLKDFRQAMYSPKATTEEKALATHNFWMWHGLSQAANVLMLAGLLVHLIRVSRPEEPGRYGTLFPKFRG
jgi:hypothetical protein